MAGFFKSLLATDRVIRVFCTGRLVHPVCIQLFGLAGGYDGFWLDAEHAGISTEQITMAALVGRACGLGSFVRMPVTNYATVTQALESGVDGVMAAQVGSAAEAEKFVTWAKFAPRGVRGVNTQGADADFTHKSPAEFAATPIATISSPSRSKRSAHWKKPTRSRRSKASTCCSSARPICRRRWACSASRITRRSGRDRSRRRGLPASMAKPGASCRLVRPMPIAVPKRAAA